MSQLKSYLDETHQSVAVFAAKAKLSEKILYKILSGNSTALRKATIMKIVRASEGNVTADGLYGIFFPSPPGTNGKHRRPRPAP